MSCQIFICGFFRRRISKFDARLRLDALIAIGMFDSANVADQIGQIHQLRRGVTARDDDVQIGPALAQCLQHSPPFEITVVQNRVKFVENHQLIARIADHPLRFGPSLPGCGDVPVPILGQPGETSADGVKLHIFKAAERGALGAVLGAFDELDDKGLIVDDQPSSFNWKMKQATRWRFTHMSANGKPPTSEWREWRKEDEKK